MWIKNSVLKTGEWTSHPLTCLVCHDRPRCSQMCTQTWGSLRIWEGRGRHCAWLSPGARWSLSRPLSCQPGSPTTSSCCFRLFSYNYYLQRVKTDPQTLSSQQQNMPGQLTRSGKAFDLFFIFDLNVVRPFWDQGGAYIVRTHNVLQSERRRKTSLHSNSFYWARIANILVATCIPWALHSEHCFDWSQVHTRAQWATWWRLVHMVDQCSVMLPHSAVISVWTLHVCKYFVYRVSRVVSSHSQKTSKLPQGLTNWVNGGWETWTKQGRATNGWMDYSTVPWAPRS